MKQRIIGTLKHILLVSYIFILPAGVVSAQHNNTIFWMQGIPQSSYSNPGLQPKAGFYLGLPGVSSVYAGFLNRGFAPSDIFAINPDGSLFINDTTFLANLQNKNHFAPDAQVDILGFGFRSKRDYFSFNITNKITGQFGYPRDLMALLLRGNDYFLSNSIPGDLSGIGLNMSHYHELGIGYSRRWTDNLTAGVRLKALLGLANLNFERNNLQLVTDPDNFALLLASDLLINKSLPIQISPIDSIGKPGHELNYEDIDPVDYISNTQNLGFAIDLGASYKINDYFTVTASMIDLGFIRWNSDVENFAMSGEFEFDGIEVDDFFLNEQGTETDPFNDILDTISDIFEITETTNSYRTALNTKVFASVAFHPTDAHKFGILGRGLFFYGQFIPSFTLSYNWQPIPHLGTSLSYSLINGRFNNVGAGLHLNLGPLQVYTVVDNFWPALRPHTLQAATVHLGVNIVTGFRERKDPAKPSFRWQP